VNLFRDLCEVLVHVSTEADARSQIKVAEFLSAK